MPPTPSAAKPNAADSLDRCRSGATRSRIIMKGRITAKYRSIAASKLNKRAMPYVETGWMRLADVFANDRKYPSAPGKADN